MTPITIVVLLCCQCFHLSALLQVASSFEMTKRHVIAYLAGIYG
jgi:hypothetical protein